MHKLATYISPCQFLTKVTSKLDVYSGANLMKIDLNKKLDPKQNTIQNFTIDAQGFRKTKNENPPTWEKGVTS